MKANDDNWKAPVSSAYGFEEEGKASWYGPGFEGRKTANGETFRTAQMTAAHKSLPMNSVVEVTNVNNGKTAIVRINDRGPFITGRIIDLSQAAAQEIGMMQAGTAEVKIRALDEAEIKALQYAQNQQ
jgi:rare lipoprotein A